MAQQKTSAGLSIYQVKQRHEFELLNIAGVTGVGIGEEMGKPGSVIKVYVERMTPELKRQIPKKIEGYAVSIEHTGEIRAF